MIIIKEVRQLLQRKGVTIVEFIELMTEYTLDKDEIQNVQLIEHLIDLNEQGCKLLPTGVIEIDLDAKKIFD